MKALTTFLVVFLLTTVTYQIYLSVHLKQNCTGFLKRAADANTVETAKDQLGKAIGYLEAKDITSGYTSVLWKTPDEDISFWYNNIKSSQNELSKVDSNTSSLEKSNLLMKLRETLIDNGEKGDKLTVPAGLSRYPNNLTLGIINTFNILIAFFLMAFFSIKNKV